MKNNKTIQANNRKTYSLPSTPHWRSGFPSKPGWYPASMHFDLTCLRFFDGKKWSWPAYPDETQTQAANIASIETLCQRHHLLWTDPWWTPEAQAKIKAGA
jgi:hypothetical protein